MMTTRELSDNEVLQASRIIATRMGYAAKTFKYHYDDMKYFETDIDLIDVEFTEETFRDDIHQLIAAYKEILNALPLQIEFIAANDDTDTEVNRYEKDINDVEKFGLFVTERTIANLKPYYSSETCNAYMNLTDVSFGVYF